MQIKIDVGRCEGHGRCYDVAPGVFEPDDEGHAVLIDTSGAVAADQEAAVSKAVRNCPERALSLDQ